MSILIWILMAYGMSNVLVYGSIFNTPRELIKEAGKDDYMPFQGVFKFISDLISCMMCTSTWVGFFFAWTIYSPTHEYLEVSNWGSWFFDGMLASGAVWAINSIVEWFEG